MSTADTRDNPLWSFMLQRYGRDGVREGCLALQDGARVDVSFLFACAWLAERGTSVEAARPALAAALESVGALRGEVLRPVRAARRALKLVGSEEEVGDARQLVKRAELAVESLCVERIHAALDDTPVGQVRGDLRALFAIYLELERLTLDEAGERNLAEVASALVDES